MKLERTKPINLPSGFKRLLLASCCAPCSAEVMESLKSNAIEFTLFFYNPNIQPFEEYQKRLEENKTFAQKLGIKFIERPYDLNAWQREINGLEKEPERGLRCEKCFYHRLKEAGLWAKENGFDIFSSVLGISRWKNMNQVNRAGKDVSNEIGIPYWDYNWRKDNGSILMEEICKKEGFYKQQFCGCTFSMKK